MVNYSSHYATQFNCLVLVILFKSFPFANCSLSFKVTFLLFRPCFRRRYRFNHESRPPRSSRTRVGANEPVEVLVKPLKSTIRSWSIFNTLELSASIDTYILYNLIKTHSLLNLFEIKTTHVFFTCSKKDL